MVNSEPNKRFDRTTCGVTQSEWCEWLFPKVMSIDLFLQLSDQSDDDILNTPIKYLNVTKNE